MRFKLSISLLVLIFLGSAIWYWQSSTRGEPAQDFRLYDLEGEAHQLAEYEGHPVIINFWATWCVPCRTEMPTLEAIYAEHQDEGLIILAVNANESPNNVAKVAENNGLTFPILLDPEFKTAKRYAVDGYPMTYFIDRDGRITSIQPGGPMDEKLIEEHLSAILD